MAIKELLLKICRNYFYLAFIIIMYLAWKFFSSKKIAQLTSIFVKRTRCARCVAKFI